MTDQRQPFTAFGHELPGQVTDLSSMIDNPGIRIVHVPVLHARQPVDGCPRDLPLCWVTEVAQRVGEHDPTGWQVAFDHDALPGYALVTTEDPTCPDCLEWIHA